MSKSLKEGFVDKTFKPALKESDVKNYFNKRKSEIEHIAKFIPYSPYPFGEPGPPDKVGCILIDGKGINYLLEFKMSDNHKTKKNQDLRRVQWERVGAVVKLLDSKEKVHQFIEEVKTYG